MIDPPTFPWPWPTPPGWPRPQPGPFDPTPPDWPIGPSPGEPIPEPGPTTGTDTPTTTPVPMPGAPPAPGAPPSGTPQTFDFKKFLLWLAALGVLWLILGALADTGNEKFAYSLAALILGGALMFMGPQAIKNAQQLFA